MSTPSCKIVAVEHLTLDGVYQAPARADEDERDGFSRGGWSVAGDDPKMQEAIGRHMAKGWSLLVGTTTYEDLYEGWQVRQPESTMAKSLAEAQKFVVSRKDDYELPWANSTLLTGEATETVAKLKKTHDKTLMVFGSGVLLRSLLAAGLVDEMVLMTHPLVLGEGRRLFDGPAAVAKLELVEEFKTGTGVIVATYRVLPD